jgi:hypothetical protein
VPDAPDPLGPLVGNLWVPVWAVRPGSYAALRKMTAAVPLWLALHSRNGDYATPAYASRDTLGATVGMSRATVSRRLGELRKAALLFEVDCGKDRATREHRPPARWALDPFAADRWRPKVEASLKRIHQQDRQNGRWLHRAMTSLDSFERRSRALRTRIEADMPDRLVHAQRQKEASRRKKRARKEAESRPRLILSPGSNLIHQGRGGTREGDEGERRKGGPATGRNGKRPSLAEGENVEKIGRPQSDGSDTRDTPEAPALQGVSGSRGQK